MNDGKRARVGKGGVDVVKLLNCDLFTLWRGPPKPMGIESSGISEQIFPLFGFWSAFFQFLSQLLGERCPLGAAPVALTSLD
jgi:hypothetical protein